MPKPTRAEMAALVERLHEIAETLLPSKMRHVLDAADAIEALMQDRAEPKENK